MNHLYAQKDDMLIEDRAILKQQTNIKEMKTHQLQKFIQTIAPIVKQSTREAKKLGKQQCKLTQFSPAVRNAPILYFWHQYFFPSQGKPSLPDHHRNQILHATRNQVKLFI